MSEERAEMARRLASRAPEFDAYFSNHQEMPKAINLLIAIKKERVSDSIQLPKDEIGEKLQDLEVGFRATSLQEAVDLLKKINQEKARHKMSESEIRVLVDGVTMTTSDSAGTIICKPIGVTEEDSLDAIRSILGKHGVNVPKRDTILSDFYAVTSGIPPSLGHGMTFKKFEETVLRRTVGAIHENKFAGTMTLDDLKKAVKTAVAQIRKLNYGGTELKD